MCAGMLHLHHFRRCWHCHMSEGVQLTPSLPNPPSAGALEPRFEPDIETLSYSTACRRPRSIGSPMRSVGASKGGGRMWMYCRVIGMVDHPGLNRFDTLWLLSSISRCAPTGCSNIGVELTRCVISQLDSVSVWNWAVGRIVSGVI